MAKSGKTAEKIDSKIPESRPVAAEAPRTVRILKKTDEFLAGFGVKKLFVYLAIGLYFSVFVIGLLIGLMI